MSISEQLTYCTTKIVATLPNGSKSIGTGFFMNFNVDNELNTYQPVVLTNKHVISNAINFEISLCKADENNNPLDKERFTIRFDKYDVINHSDKDVDLCAIPIAGVEDEIRNSNIKLYKGSFDTSLIIKEDEMSDYSAIEDIIMIGYPNGLEDSYNNKPIVRRGITSTHIKNNYNNKKEFMIDMACFPGSSGSPVLICNENSFGYNGALYAGSRVKLLGLLYAGPQFINEGDIVFDYISTAPKVFIQMPINLGLVIKAERILELEKIMKGKN